MAYPPPGYVSNAARTDAEMKTALEDWLAADKQAALPAGGAAGHVLTKSSGADFAAGWAAPAGGGGSGLWFPITPLDQSSWAWVNQGDAAITQASGLVHLAAGAASPQNVSLRVVAAPTPPYTITAALINDAAMGATFPVRSGLAWRDGVGGGFIAVGYLGGNGVFEVLKFNSPTSYNSQYAVRNTAARPSLAFLRIGDDGTSRRVWTSFDGVNFRLLHTVGRTDFITPNQVGLFVGRESGLECAFTVLSWAQA